MWMDNKSGTSPMSGSKPRIALQETESILHFCSSISLRNACFDEKMAKIWPFKYSPPLFNAGIIPQRGLDATGRWQTDPQTEWGQRRGLAVGGFGGCNHLAACPGAGTPFPFTGDCEKKKKMSIFIRNDFAKSSTKWNYLPLTCSTRDQSSYAGV